MPLRPGLPCAMPGCGHLQPCSRHPKRYLSDRMRGTAQRRGYGARHRLQREEILARDPICRGCEAAPSTHDDHIVPIENGGSADDPMNQQGLCGAPGPIGPYGACHSFKTAVEQRDPFFGMRLREEGHKVGQPAPYGWRKLRLFGGEQ